MKKQKNISLVVFLVIAIVIGIFYLGKNFAPGSYPDAEIYSVDFPEKNLLNAIEKFKNQNPEYKVPRVTINNNGSFDIEKYEENNDSKWKHIYFYLKNENQIILTWTRQNKNGVTDFALVGINKGLNIGNWKTLNRDLSYDESMKLKKKFSSLIFEPVKEILVSKD